MPFYFNIYISLSCNNLPKALDMFRKTPLTSTSLSTEVKYHEYFFSVNKKYSTF